MFFAFLIASIPFWAFWIEWTHRRIEYNRDGNPPVTWLLVHPVADEWWFKNSRLRLKVLSLSCVWAFFVVTLYLHLARTLNPRITIDSDVLVLLKIAPLPIWVWFFAYVTNWAWNYRKSGRSARFFTYDELVDGWWFGNARRFLGVFVVQAVWTAVVIGMYFLAS